MKVILKSDYQNLGTSGSVVTVKDGYARNFLIPNGIAVKADRSALKVLDEETRVADLRKNKEKRTAEKVAEKLAKISLTAKVTVGEEDKLFGTVTTQDIAELLKEKGFEFDRRKIELTDPIKELGVYNVDVKLHSEVTVKVKLWVIKN